MVVIFVKVFAGKSLKGLVCISCIILFIAGKVKSRAQAISCIGIFVCPFWLRASLQVEATGLQGDMGIDEMGDGLVEGKR